MNSLVHTKTFKSGNSVAVRLPKGFAIPADTEVTAESFGDGVLIRPRAKRQTLAEMAARLLALGPVGDIEQRQVDLPERSGL